MSIGGSVALIVIGAILRFAVTYHAKYVNIQAIGVILMIGGAAGLFVASIALVVSRRRERPPTQGGRTASVYGAAPVIRTAPWPARPTRPVRTVSAVRPVDPRLLRYARAAQGYLAVAVGPGLAGAALILAQAGLLAHALAAAARGSGTDALGGTLLALLAVVPARAAAT